MLEGLLEAIIPLGWVSGLVLHGHALARALGSCPPWQVAATAHVLGVLALTWETQMDLGSQLWPLPVAVAGIRE